MTSRQDSFGEPFEVQPTIWGIADGIIEIETIYVYVRAHTTNPYKSKRGIEDAPIEPTARCRRIRDVTLPTGEKIASPLIIFSAIKTGQVAQFLAADTYYWKTMLL
jgi:hypothetical protein